MITRLRGGLGNQMFAYALSRHLVIKNKTKLKLDLTYIKIDGLKAYGLNDFNITGEVIPFPYFFPIIPKTFFKILKILSKKLNKKDLYFGEKRRCFFKKKILEKNVFVLDGYWTCEGYFKDISDIIRKDFTLKKELDKENKSMLKKIKNSNSVCIHIRRGERASDPWAKKMQEPCSLDYYDKSMKLISKKTKNPHFFTFSDDPKWVKENLKTKFPMTYVDFNNVKGVAKDLNLMKHCKHFIIAKSTVSWWGAWLSENKDKIIIAPERWFDNGRKEGDVIPKEWIRVKE